MQLDWRPCKCRGRFDVPLGARDRIVEPEDPFAAWETIDLIKSQHGQLRKVVEELKFALFSSDMTIKDRADQSARLILAATTEGQP